MSRFLDYLSRTRFRRQLDFLIYFVTSRCQGNCRSCFYWRGLNRGRELSLSEIERIVPSLGPFHTLLLSGGEPFLRQDLVQICQTFYKNNQPKSIIIPTNGILYNLIPGKVEEILKACPKTKITINIT